MDNLRNLIDKFLLRHNGADQLAFCAAIVSIVCLIASTCFPALHDYLLIVGLVALWYTLFRLFSTSKVNRRKENDAFVSFFAGNPEKRRQRAEKKEKDKKRKEKLKTHALFECPGCHSECYVPKGRGKVRITCPKCGHKFIGKT